MQTIICDAFSLNMLEPGRQQRILCAPLTTKRAREFAGEPGVASAVDHPETAALFSKVLEVEVPVNRLEVKLGSEVRLLVGQPGPASLPTGAAISWWLVFRYSINNTQIIT